MSFYVPPPGAVLVFPPQSQKNAAVKPLNNLHHHLNDEEQKFPARDERIKYPHPILANPSDYPMNQIVLMTPKRSFDPSKDDVKFINSALKLISILDGPRKGLYASFWCKKADQTYYEPATIQFSDQGMFEVNDKHQFHQKHIVSIKYMRETNQFTCEIKAKLPDQLKENHSDSRVIASTSKIAAKIVPQVLPKQPLDSDLRGVKIQSKVEMTAKGDNGQDGQNGREGGEGTIGTSGGNGKRMDIYLSLQSGVIVVTNGAEKYFISLGDPNAFISINASGGNGGRGGSGGRGADSNLSSYHYAYTNTTTYSHSSAQSGGRGGSGGKGGDGGQVTIFVDPENVDLLSLLKVDVTGGEGGDGGYGGSGGYRYENTLPLTPLEKINDALNGTKTVKERNAPSGATGQKGENGKDGHYIIKVGNVRYTSPCNLEIESCVIQDSNQDGIIEPTDKLSLTLAVKNSGSIHAPSTFFRVLPTPGVMKFNSSAAELGLLEGYSRKVLNEKLYCLLSPLKQPVGAHPRVEARVLKFCATMARVQKEIATITDHATSFQIRYPVEMSPVRWTPSTIVDGDAFFSHSVKNISTKEIGIQSDQQRPVELIVEIDKQKNGVLAKDIQFFTTQLQAIPGENGTKMLMGKLLPNQEVTHSGSIQFTNNQIPPYSKVHLTASLYLGSVNNPNEKICIQKQQFSIQLAQPYYQVPSSDFLLVTNSDTTQEEFEAWLSIAQAFHLTMNVWNASLYHGISLYQHIQSTNSSLVQDFAQKTIVFLNQSEVVDRLPSFELFKAARDHDIKSYIIGGNDIFENRHLLSPSREEIQSTASKVISGTYQATPPDLERLRGLIKKEAESFRKRDPRFGYHIVELFSSRHIPSDGHYKIFTAPRKDRPFFFQLNGCNGEIHQPTFVKSAKNSFSLLKMIPFEKKLSLFSALSVNNRAILEGAILSDLADEIFVFSQDKSTGDWSTEDLKMGLSVLKTFLEWPWSDVVKDEQVRIALLNLFMKYRAFIKCLKQPEDALPYRRQRLLFNGAKELVDQFMTKSFGLTKEQWLVHYQPFKDKFKADTPAKLFSKVRNPLGMTYKHENRSAEYEIVSSLALPSQAEIRRSTVNERLNHIFDPLQRAVAIQRLERGTPQKLAIQSEQKEN